MVNFSKREMLVAPVAPRSVCNPWRVRGSRLRRADYP